VSTGSKTRVRRHWQWYAPHRAIVLVGVVLTLIALAGGFLGVVNASQAESASAQLTQRYLVLLPPLRTIRTSAADFQLLAAEVTNSTAPADLVLPEAERDTDTINKSFEGLERLLASPGDANLAPGLARRMATYVAAQNSLGALLAGQTHTAQTAHLSAVETSAFTNLDTTIAATQTTITNRLTTTATQAHTAANRARVDLLWSIAIGVLIAGTAVALITRHALQVEHEQSRSDAVQSDVARRIAFGSSLQTALEMSRAETSAFDIVAEALSLAAPGMRSELLLADSSKAHFRQVLVSSAETDVVGCGVISPDDCPAALSSRNMVFPDSTALDACPNLRGRHCSALCVPMSISGNSIGVFHVMAEDGSPPSDTVEQDMEVVARRASERLAMLRAFEVSQTQANSDSLTGLMTRRSLEAAVRDLQSTGTPYSVAYGDLDHFKILNDTFGHAAGDRALRTFSQVLRDSLRPNDIPGRYGGEEFVIVLPECPLDEARQVLGRVRERLAERIVVADLPPFAISFGLASSDQAADFDLVVALADAALLSAKAGGRDRVVTSTGASEPAPNPAAVRVGVDPGSHGNGDAFDVASREPQHS
jgi:diguanylate cyclase (GGDEF)-like protein